MTIGCAYSAKSCIDRWPIFAAGPAAMDAWSEQRALVDQQLDGRETASVQHAGAEPLQCGEMLRRGVALVAGEAVARVVAVHHAHQPVAGDLGEDRGRADSRFGRVAADDGAAGTWQGFG